MFGGMITTQHTAASGQFFVAAELSRRGWAVGLTRAGMKNTDILAEHTATGKVVVIQLKASTGNSFTISVKNEELNRPGMVGDFWPWRIKDGVHAIRAQQWEADHASVFG
jgi:hypothetical protein